MMVGDATVTPNFQNIAQKAVYEQVAKVTGLKDGRRYKDAEGIEFKAFRAEQETKLLGFS